jgi:NAD-dependent DNA ligase
MTAGLLYDVCKTKKFSDLYSLDVNTLLTLEGFKIKKAENLINAIEKSKTPNLSQFILALGIDGIGKKTAKDLVNEFKTLENIKNDESIQGLWAGVIDYAPFFNGLLGDSDEKLVENVMIDMTVVIRADGTYTGGFQKESFNSAIEKIKPVLIREFTRIYSEMADRAGVDLKSFLASIGHDSVESVADAQLSFDPEKMTLEGQYLAYDGKLYVSLNTEEKPDMNSYGVYTVNGNELTMSDIVEDEDSTYGLLNAVMVPITFTKQQ